MTDRRSPYPHTEEVKKNKNKKVALVASMAPHSVVDTRGSKQLEDPNREALKFKCFIYTKSHSKSGITKQSFSSPDKT